MRIENLEGLLHMKTIFGKPLYASPILSDPLQNTSPLLKFISRNEKDIQKKGGVIEVSPLLCDMPAVSSQRSQSNIQKLINTLSIDTLKKEDIVDNAKKTIGSDGVARAIYNLATAVMQEFQCMVIEEILYIFNNTIWKKLSWKGLLSLMKDNFFDLEAVSLLNERNVRELYLQLTTTPQIIMEAENVEHNPHMIQFCDGVYNIESGHTLPCNSEYQTFSCINASISDLGNSDGYYFEKFVDSLSDGCTNIRQLLLEIIGVTISGYNPKAIFLLMGEKNSGKTQFLNFCKCLVGEKSCVSVKSLNAFAERWTAASLFGKKLCVCPDVPRKMIIPDAIATLKQLVGEDYISAEQKYKDPFSFVNEATLVFASNHKLSISSASEEDAFLSRIIVVPFLKSAPDSEIIPNIYRFLLNEKGYILALAIDALRQLIANNFRFTMVDACFCQTTAPYDIFENFISACCELDEAYCVSSAELYRCFERYTTQDEQCALSSIAFSRTLFSKFPSLRHCRNTDGTRAIGGIRILDS